MASNLGAAKSIAPCEATEPGKYLLINTYFNSKNIEFRNHIIFLAITRFRLYIHCNLRSSCVKFRINLKQHLCEQFVWLLVAFVK